MAFLILFPNNIADKEALYSVAENAEVLEEYKGWWSCKDGELLLSMTMYGGRDYVEGRGIYGTYTEVATELADMALEHKYGDSLTIYMSNSGKDFSTEATAENSKRKKEGDASAYLSSSCQKARVFVS